MSRHRYGESEINCPYNCGFSGTERAWETHLVLHGKATAPKPGSQAEIAWLQYGLTEDSVANRQERCKMCREVFPGLLAIQQHIRTAHPQVVGGA